MIVLGFTVTPKIEAACLERMHAGWFSAAQLVDVIWGIPKVSYDISDRIADRLIQRERKAGKIKRYGKGWLPTSRKVPK